jgi:hypothetical protein
MRAASEAEPDRADMLKRAVVECTVLCAQKLKPAWYIVIAGAVRIAFGSSSIQ